MKDYKDFTLTAKSVVIFKNILNNKVISSFLELLETDEDKTDKIISRYSDFVSALYETTDDLSEYINSLLQNDENAFVKSAAKGDPSPLMLEALQNELDFFEKLSKITSEEICNSISVDVFLPRWKNSSIKIKDEYNKKIYEIKTTGYGIFAEHRMFLYKENEIVPVKYPDPQRLSQMSGYELERQKVIDNTLALLNGKPCNNVLLYGDAGRL